MVKIISIINWKGGVGKTTTALNIGAALARFGEFGPSRVLLVDLDPQTNLTYSVTGIDRYVNWAYTERRPTLKDLYRDYLNNENKFDIEEAIIKDPIGSTPNVHLLPSHLDLIFIDMQLARKKGVSSGLDAMLGEELDRLSILQNIFKKVEKNYDYILCDCPPNFNLVTQNAIFASEAFIIPALPDFLSTVGIQQIVQKIGELNCRVRDYLDVYEEPPEYRDTELKGILFTRVKEYAGQPKGSHYETISRIIREFPSTVFGDGTLYITEGDGLVKASDNFLTIFDYACGAKDAISEKQARQYRECAGELYRRLNGEMI